MWINICECGYASIALWRSSANITYIWTWTDWWHTLPRAHRRTCASSVRRFALSEAQSGNSIERPSPSSCIGGAAFKTHHRMTSLLYTGNFATNWGFKSLAEVRLDRVHSLAVNVSFYCNVIVDESVWCTFRTMFSQWHSLERVLLRSSASFQLRFKSC